MSFLEVEAEAIAPAIFSGQMPSTPSVPIERIVVFFGAFLRQARTNCWFLPPLPLPVILTVVSPVNMNKPFLPDIFFMISAAFLPQSPSMCESNIFGWYFEAIFLAVIAVVSWLASIFDNIFFVVLGVSVKFFGGVILYFLKIFRASSTVVGSGETGPEAIALKSLPNTSEITKLKQVAG